MKLSIHPVDLRLKHRFTTNIDSRTVQHSHVVQVEQDGIVGLGEVTAHPFYKISREKILAEGKQIEKYLSGKTLDTPDLLWDELSPLLPDNRFLLSGIDVAVNDLYAKQRGKPLYKLWDLEVNALPLTSYTIGLDTLEVMASKLQEVPWPVYKIKLGTENDLALIQTLRELTDVPFRVDANCAWDNMQLAELSKAFRDLGIEYIEQALHPDMKDAIKESLSHSVLPLFADESFKTENDIEFCAKHYTGINIKLVKCGGLTPAKRIAEQALSLGAEIMIGCMTESSIGISAAAQLLPYAKYADLDGALLIENDIASGLKIDFGKMEYAEGDGIACELL